MNAERSRPFLAVGAGGFLGLPIALSVGRFAGGERS
jgi:hypothetical protein